MSSMLSLISELFAEIGQISMGLVTAVIISSYNITISIIAYSAIYRPRTGWMLTNSVHYSLNKLRQWLPEVFKSTFCTCIYNYNLIGGGQCMIAYT